ncbi:hypothetical protein OESDEN_12821 [Oesophagostomum dentatum]|uniref:Uncharacterized protein n=1 Tax=Oesophagostomum dentatum TaxID=61180 RepID=A0A0B1SV35_OESDE|nr:hypothetical protein OESDEN_12821 [Oesophagostomum dentatum]
MIAYIPLYIFASLVAFLLVVPCGHTEGAQFDTIMEEEEIRPEQLPSLYTDLTTNMIEKVMGLTVGGGTSVTADDAGLLELQPTM